VHPDLAPADRDVVVTKTRVGAFSTTNLHTHLTSRGIDTLVLGGVSTSGVVLSTVRHAADRDYRLLVLAECCLDEPDLHALLVGPIFPARPTSSPCPGWPTCWPRCDVRVARQHPAPA
jgi:nicotinamidase-related amidase